MAGLVVLLYLTSFSYKMEMEANLISKTIPALFVAQSLAFLSLHLEEFMQPGIYMTAMAILICAIAICVVRIAGWVAVLCCLPPNYIIK
jgi:hypothetical protein